MVNPAICRKCPHCGGVEEPIRDEGRLVAECMIECEFEAVLLVGNEPPVECPYVLEHKLTEEDSSIIKEGWDEERRDNDR